MMANQSRWAIVACPSGQSRICLSEDCAGRWPIWQGRLVIDCEKKEALKSLSAEMANGGRVVQDRGACLRTV